MSLLFLFLFVSKSGEKEKETALAKANQEKQKKEPVTSAWGKEPPKDNSPQIAGALDTITPFFCSSFLVLELKAELEAKSKEAATFVSKVSELEQKLHQASVKEKDLQSG
jgi:hypothetical protein